MEGKKMMWSRAALAGLTLGLCAVLGGAGAQDNGTQGKTVLQPILPNILKAGVVQPGGPQSLTVIPEDGAVTLLWQAPAVRGQFPLSGYDVFIGSQKVNEQPIPAVKTGGVQSYRVKGLKNGASYDFRVVALTPKAGTTLGTASVSGRPLVCERYRVQGTDMGALFQNIRVSRGPASVSINGTNIPASGGIYQGQLPAALPVGGPLNLLTAVGDCLVFATDNVPSSPVLTAPAAGLSAPVNAPLTVAWNLTSHPDRIVVSATWLENPTTGTGWRSGDLSGSVRSFNIPAGTLPAGKTVKIRVYAYNDGTESFVGSFTPDSRMAIRNGDEAGRDINTIAAPVVTNPPAVSWGDPHLLTFDQTAVEFQAVGEFDLAQSTTGGELRVQARQRPWGGSTSVSVNTAVATRFNGQKVGVYVGSTPALRVGDTGVRTAVPAGGLNFGAGYRVTQAGNVYTFEYPGGERMTLTHNGAYIDARVSLPDTRRGQMRGLWGNFDGNTINDLFLRGGAPLAMPVTTTDFYGPYANSWRVPSPDQSLFVYDGGERFGGFDDPTFPRPAPAAAPDAQANAERVCRAAGVTDPILLQACITDVVTTGQPAFASSTAATQRPRDQVTLAAPALPDLVVAAASAQFTGVCRPNQAYITARVTVRNIGTAASPARSDVGLAQVIDSRDEGLGTGGRGNGVGLPSVPAGGSATVDIPVYYPISTPADAPGTHTFIARVNVGNWISEANTANNRFATPISVTVPAGVCP